MVILYKNTIEMKDKTSHLQLHEKIKKDVQIKSHTLELYSASLNLFDCKFYIYSLTKGPFEFLTLCTKFSDAL